MMTPDPSTPSDDFQAPLGKRGVTSNIHKASAEMDLWSFDAEDEGLADEGRPQEMKSVQMMPRGIPAARLSEAERFLAQNEASTLRPESKKAKVEVNVKPSRPKRGGEKLAHSGPKAGREFDDLEDWDDAEVSKAEELALDEISEVPASAKAEDLAEVVEVAEEAEPIAKREAEEDFPVPGVEEEGEMATAEDVADGKEGSVTRVSELFPWLLKPVLALSKLERIGLAALLAVLILGGGSVLALSIYGLPKESERVFANDFPVKGERVSVIDAVTYWRTPIVEGANPDVFRRGTVFLPVVKLRVGEGNAALRVAFRDQDGALIGDVKTRAVTAGEIVEIPATAGFDNAGMHAAYRTGQSKPWTVLLSEADDLDAPTSAFKKLFEMNISTDRR